MLLNTVNQLDIEEKFCMAYRKNRSIAFITSLVYLMCIIILLQLQINKQEKCYPTVFIK